MPRPNAYAICLTKKVQKRLLDLLSVIQHSACPTHNGPNFNAAILAIEEILTNKKVHRSIQG